VTGPPPWEWPERMLSWVYQARGTPHRFDRAGQPDWDCSTFTGQRTELLEVAVRRRLARALREYLRTRTGEQCGK
jgi:hypothetical protein